MKFDNKHVLFALLCSACLLTHAAAPKKQPAATASSDSQRTPDPVTDFKSLVASASPPKEWTEVTQHPKNLKWLKKYFSTGEIRYDVKKTDSLVTPIKGIVSFPVRVLSSNFYDTKEEAESSTELWDIADVTYFLTGDYLIDDGKWRLNQFSLRSKFKGNIPEQGPFYMSRDEIEAGSTRWGGIDSILKRWLR